MSAIAATGKLIAASVAGAAAASATAELTASLWGVTVLGIPLGVLAASLTGSGARSLRDPSQDERALPRRALNTLVDGFIGGWAAMLIVTLPASRGYVAGVEPAILGAFGGLLTEFARTNGPRWANQAVQAALSLLSRGRKPEDAP